MYKKWFCKLALFTILFIFLDVLLGICFKEVEGYALKKAPLSWHMHTDYSIKCVQEEALIFGASEANHSYVSQVFSDSLGLSVDNCGVDGMPAYCQIAVVNCILNRYTPKLIIWSVTPSWLSERNKERVSMLKPFYKDYPYCRDIVNKILKFESIKCLSNCYNFNSTFYSYFSCIINPESDFEYGHYWPLKETQNAIELQEDDVIERPYSSDVADVFAQTLKNCNEKGVKVVLVITPMYEKGDYSNLLTYTKMKEIAGDCGVELIEDYYRNPEIHQVYNYKDAGHLNDKGAHLFSAMLAERLKAVL